MSKNKIIIGIIFLWALFIIYSIWFDDAYARFPSAVISINLLIQTLIFVPVLLIGNLLFLRVFRVTPFCNLKDQIFISGGAIVFSLLIIAALLPKVLNIHSQGRETSAIQGLQQIHRNEAAFYSIRKRFANLDELVDASLLGKNYRENQVVGDYRFSTTGVTNQTFCIHADRVKKSAGDRDFNITEEGEVRSITSEKIGTVARDEGRLLTDEAE